MTSPHSYEAAGEKKMTKLNRVVLGLATVTLLASCGAKEITKAEAVEIAKGYDTAAVVYKSCKAKIETKTTFSENVPEAIRNLEEYASKTEEQELTSEEDILSARISAFNISTLDEKTTTFKADGKKLEFTSKQGEGDNMMTIYCSADENGYPVVLDMETKLSMPLLGDEPYKVTVSVHTSYTWTK